MNHEAERRQPGRHTSKHFQIIAGLESLSGDDRFAARLQKRLLELHDAIRRIQSHKDKAGPGRCELQQHPFRIVRRPDAHAVTRHEPQRDQARG